MFRERILEEKERQNLSVKTMAYKSQLQLSEETVRRILTAKTADPGINAVLDIAETVGLKPYELFMDATTAQEFKAFLELKLKTDETEAERIRMVAEHENLKVTNAGLVDRIRVLEIELAHKEEIIDIYKSFNKVTQDEIIPLLNYYNKLKRDNEEFIIV